MDWVIVSISSAFAFGIVSVLDKLILTRYAPSALTFIVLVGLIQLPASLLILPFVPLESHSISVWAAAYFSGLSWGLSLYIMFWVMSTREVSRVVPVVSASPVFVAILSVLFLSEDLSALHWVAIFVTVAGAALISLRTEGSSQRIVLDSAFSLMVLSSLLLAVGQFLSKVALDDDLSLWNLWVVRNLGLTTGTMFALRPSFFRELRMLASDRVGVGVFVLSEGFIVLIATLLTLWGILLGPVSLAATLMSTRPFFVFVLSMLLSTQAWRVLNEPLDRDTLAQKFVSTAMIVGGISAIALL